MGKDARPRDLADNQARAIGRNIRVSPRKLNLVAQAIRGSSAEAALATLTFSPKRIAQDVKKILQSAIANAENNHDLDVDDLVVTEASVGRNLVMKRFHARARGRGARIEKPFSQITIVVEEKRAVETPKSVNLSPERRAAVKAEGGEGKKKRAPAKKSGGKAGSNTNAAGKKASKKETA
jgi:large subunit ribosomal protein L22